MALKLTNKQEKYCQLLADGMSQYDAYLGAYPNAKNYKRCTVDTQASILASNSKIIERIEELNKPAVDILQSKKIDLAEHAIKMATKNDVPGNPQVLNNLLNKLFPTISESKTEINAVSLMDIIKAKRAANE